ncbi:TBC1 domain family member 13-like isoform X1 [Zingiber officinale]|uniref:TBC1 domain family member 13-like isoform X1 n=1 Tax=Zingiber officinale TaxID=94328 RepID=UPI001C4B17A2|nr:TBC1 domain family member 13-like isoform X1 [Zingiber officinale]
MSLKGKLKIPDSFMPRLPDRSKTTMQKKKDADGDGGEIEDEELLTFHFCLGIGRSDGERWPDDGEENGFFSEGSSRLRTLFRIEGKEVSLEKRSELEFQLSQNVINLEVLQSIACCGDLDRDFRSIVWKQLLLGYLPTQKHLWEEELVKNRLRFSELKREHLVNPSEHSTEDELVNSTRHCQDNDTGGLLCRREISNGDHPLCLANGSFWNQYFKDAEIVEQIDRDLHRTHQDLNFFSGNSSFSRKNLEAMRNILLLFAKMNPAIGYVQGMNEVLALLYYVFRMNPEGEDASAVEADSFECFVRLLSGSVDHFCQQLDNSSVGIHSTLLHFSQLLKANDEELWRHLDNSKMNPQFYAFRWITLLLTQEFELSSIMRIWDCLLSHPSGVQDMLLRVCCAMLLCVRGDLLSGDFISNLKLLQHYPKVDLENLLDVAHHLIPITSPRPFGIMP